MKKKDVTKLLNTCEDANETFVKSLVHFLKTLNMDERHWWIASKVEQTFCIDKTSTADASFTESFFRRADVLDKMNNFLFAKVQINYFFIQHEIVFIPKDITCCQNIVDEYALVNESLDNIILLFFIRSDTSSDATIPPASDIYSGEIKHPAQMTSLLYSQTLLPLFKKELTTNSNESYHQTATKTAIITQMEKYIDGISATCHSLQKDKNLVSFTLFYYCRKFFFLVIKTS